MDDNGVVTGTGKGAVTITGTTIYDDTKLTATVTVAEAEPGPDEGDKTAPTQPADLKVSDVKENSVVISWKASEDNVKKSEDNVKKSDKTLTSGCSPWYNTTANGS